jgi:hypothetical protein
MPTIGSLVILKNCVAAKAGERGHVSAGLDRAINLTK